MISNFTLISFTVQFPFQLISHIMADSTMTAQTTLKLNSKEFHPAKDVYKPPSFRKRENLSGAGHQSNGSNKMNSSFNTVPKPFKNKENQENVDPHQKFDIRSFKGKPSSCVFVASLASAKTDDYLSTSVSKHFCKWGNLVMVKVLRDTSNRPYAFVQYTNDSDASRALKEAHHSMLDGRMLRCEPAKVNRTLYVRASDGRYLSEFTIKKEMLEFGEIEQVTGAHYNNGRQKLSSTAKFNAWFCKFAYRDDAVRAYASLVGDPNWEVEWAQNIENKRQRSFSGIDKSSVFVGQLSLNITKEILRKRFTSHGNILSIKMISRPSGSFAFIKYDSEEATARAVERENHALLQGKTMHVQYREISNDSSEFSDEEPSLQLAPPPVNVPTRSVFQRNMQSVSVNALKKKPLGYSKRWNSLGPPEALFSNQNQIFEDTDEESDTGREFPGRMSVSSFENHMAMIGAHGSKSVVTAKSASTHSTIRTDVSSIPANTSSFSAITPDYKSLSKPLQLGSVSYAFPDQTLPRNLVPYPYTPIRNSGSFQYPYYYDYQNSQTENEDELHTDQPSDDDQSLSASSPILAPTQEHSLYGDDLIREHNDSS